jgi:hypothetical protein
MAKKMREYGNTRSVERFDDQAGGTLLRAETLRRLILEREPLTTAEPEQRESEALG